jgi:hypothetical protein
MLSLTCSPMMLCVSMSTARADLRVKNSSPAPAAQKEHEPGERASEEFLRPCPIIQSSRFSQSPESDRPEAPHLEQRAASIYRSCMPLHADHFFILFIVSIRRNKADAARN